MKVSVLTPTCNRADWFELAVAGMKRQIYTKPIEWVIVEDGEQDVRIHLTDLPPHIEVVYVKLDEKVPIGHKRNICIQKATGDIMIFWDDDDIYFPTYIAHAVAQLTNQKWYGVVGSPILFVFSCLQNKIYLKGKFGNHTPCGVLGFTRKALCYYDMRFRNRDKHGEEAYFLKDFRVPIYPLNPRMTILAVQHGENTWNVSFDENEQVENVVMPDWALELTRKITGKKNMETS